MKFYIDYYEKGLVSGNYISACGDRAIVRIDGRLSLDTMISIGKTEGLKRGYTAFKVIKGESLLTAKDISELIIV